jgi:hypothetical protein
MNPTSAQQVPLTRTELRALARLDSVERRLTALREAAAAQRRAARQPLLPRRGVRRAGRWVAGRWVAQRPAVSTSSSQAGALFLATADPGLGVRGVLLGKELYSGGGVVYDPFELYGDLLPGPNGFLQGDVGGGKSVFGKAYCTRQIRMGRQVAVIDSKNQAGSGEWSPIARALGVEPVRFSRRSGVCLNPLDPRIARIGDQISPTADPSTKGSPAGHPDHVGQDALLRTIAEVALDRRLTPEEGYALRCAHDRATQLAAERGEPEPTLPVVVEALFTPTAGAARFARSTPDRLVEDGRKVALELDRMCRGDLAGLIDGPTSLDIDLDSPLLTFDLSELDTESDALPVVMAVIGTFLQSVWVRPDGVQRILLVEEGWHVVGNLPTARLFRRFCKLARGLGLQVLVVVHRLADLTTSGGAAAEAARALAKEAHTHALFAMKPEEAVAAVSALGLPAEAGRIIPLLPRGCCLLVVGHRLQVVQVVLTVTEEKLFFTDAAMVRPPITTGA